MFKSGLIEQIAMLNNRKNSILIVEQLAIIHENARIHCKQTTRYVSYVGSFFLVIFN